jgi:hypothetical protein
LFINLNKSFVLDPPYHAKKMHAMEKALSFSGNFAAPHKNPEEAGRLSPRAGYDIRFNELNSREHDD